MTPSLPTRRSSDLASLQRIVAKLYRSAVRLAERVVFLNPDDRREFVERRLVSPDRAVILGGIGLDLQEWSYSKPDAEAATFIMVGRLLRDKGVEEYVEAAKALHPHYPKARFLLVGGHDENQIGRAHV